jgi:hypothetical protein
LNLPRIARKERTFTNVKFVSDYDRERNRLEERLMSTQLKKRGNFDIKLKTKKIKIRNIIRNEKKETHNQGHNNSLNDFVNKYVKLKM